MENLQPSSDTPLVIKYPDENSAIRFMKSHRLYIVIGLAGVSLLFFAISGMGGNGLKTQLNLDETKIVAVPPTESVASIPSANTNMNSIGLLGDTGTTPLHTSATTLSDNSNENDSVLLPTMVISPTPAPASTMINTPVHDKFLESLQSEELADPWLKNSETASDKNAKSGPEIILFLVISGVIGGASLFLRKRKKI